MKRAIIPAVLALAFAAAVFVFMPRQAEAQHTVSSGCKSNCTFTGTTTLSGAVSVPVIDAGVIVLGAGTTNIPHIRVVSGDLFVAAPSGNDIIFETADGTERGRVKNGGQITAPNARFTNSQTAGSITLSGGTGTATVLAGSICVCTDSTANVSVKCNLSSTTLTATGTTTDVIKYICL